MLWITKLKIMNKQRFAVLIVAIIGIIAAFLPWYKIADMETISGITSSGWFTSLMFIVIVFLILRQDTKEDITMGTAWSITICSLLASFAVLWRVIDIFYSKESNGLFGLGGDMSDILGNQVTVGYGAWIVVIAGICVPLAALLFRDRSFHRN